VASSTNPGGKHQVGKRVYQVVQAQGLVDFQDGLLTIISTLPFGFNFDSIPFFFLYLPTLSPFILVLHHWW